MALSRDQDTLRIPAFLRKKSIRKKLNKPLLMTALDRKRAGQLPEGLEKKIEKKKRRQQDLLHFRNKIQKKINRRKTLKTQEPREPRNSQNFFAPPVLDFPKPKSAEKPMRRKIIGEMTHYYDKIRVGVIKLKSSLEVSDSIMYETNNGPYTQIVESMEVNREPVFKAGRGNEVGLKLLKIPRIGTSVKKM